MDGRERFFSKDAGGEEQDLSNQTTQVIAKSIKDYNGDWEKYIRFEFLRPALKNGVRYDEFWGLTPVSLRDILYAKDEQFKEQMLLRDISNWQLGQYIQLAYGDVMANAFGKRTNNYPQKPAFSKQYEPYETQSELTRAQEELETLKFKNFFDHLGDFVKIKKKGG